jgi:hypothetical protein
MVSRIEVNDTAALTVAHCTLCGNGNVALKIQGKKTLEYLQERMFIARPKVSDQNHCDDGNLQAECTEYKEHLFKTARDNVSCGPAFSGMTTLRGQAL